VLELAINELASDLSDLARVIPALAERQAAGTLRSDLTARLEKNSPKEVHGTVRLENVSASPGISGLTGTLHCSGVEVRGEEIAFLYGGEKLTAELNASLPFSSPAAGSAVIRGFGGTLNASGRLLNKEAGTFSAEFSGRDLDLAKLGAARGSRGKFSLIGTVAYAAGKFRGRKDALPASLEGNAHGELVNGAIEGVNVAAEALQKVAGIPGVAESLAKYLGPEGQELLAGSDTQFERLRADAAVGGSAIDVSSIALVHRSYSMSGRGRMEFSGKFEFKVELALAPAITNSMTARQPKLKLLLDQNGNIAFPVVVKRDGGRTLVIPDVSRLLKNAARGTVKDAAGQALDKLSPGLGGSAKELFDSLLK
jgi:hypothetical protein